MNVIPKLGEVWMHDNYHEIYIRDDRFDKLYGDIDKDSRIASQALGDGKHYHTSKTDKSIIVIKVKLLNILYGQE